MDGQPEKVTYRGVAPPKKLKHQCNYKDAFYHTMLRELNSYTFSVYKRHISHDIMYNNLIADAKRV